MKLSPAFNRWFVGHYQKFSWRFIGGGILLLTTTGRKSGLLRTIPLQYELFNHEYTLGAGNGITCDWVKNIQKNPRVSYQIRDCCFSGTAELIYDRNMICDFLAYRFQRHPLMLGMIFKIDGHSFHPGREELYTYASYLVLVVLHPDAPAE
jgi:deazaflavin-dependent oxidoreductase (nitroreductase family)